MLRGLISSHNFKGNKMIKLIKEFFNVVESIVIKEGVKYYLVDGKLSVK